MRGGLRFLLTACKPQAFGPLTPCLGGTYADPSEKILRFLSAQGLTRLAKRWIVLLRRNEAGHSPTDLLKSPIGGRRHCPGIRKGLSHLGTGPTEHHLPQKNWQFASLGSNPLHRRTDPW